MTSELFAPRARRELRAAMQWIARDNREAAEALLTVTLRAATQIAARPLLGRVRPELAPARYRFWSLHGFPYLLIYNAETRPPHILRIVHMARDLPSVLSDLGC